MVHVTAKTGGRHQLQLPVIAQLPPSVKRLEYTPFAHPLPSPAGGLNLGHT